MTYNTISSKLWKKPWTKYILSKRERGGRERGRGRERVSERVRERKCLSISCNVFITKKLIYRFFYYNLIQI